MRVSTGNDQCSVEITQQVDTPGTVSISVSPTSIEYGESVSISVSFSDSDGISLIKIKRGAQIIGTKTTCPGTSCSYSLSDTPPSTGSVVYTAIGQDTNGNPTEKARTVTVTGATIPSVSLVVSPTSLATGQAASFAVSASDSGSDLYKILVYYGDGALNNQLCSGGSCAKTWSHSYTTSGTKNAYASVIDNEGHTAQSMTVPVYVTAPSDADSDGITDADDVCDATPTWARPVVTAAGDPYRGCACEEIRNFEPSPIRDSNPCTDDSCSIVNGGFVPVHTPISGGQPEGYTDGCAGGVWVDYTCTDGAVTSTSTANPQCVSCTSHAAQSCWDGDAYWVDSCGNREQPPKDDCAAGEACVLTTGVASCQELACTPDCVTKSCGASDGCNGFCDVESCAAGQSCEPSGTTYTCTPTCSPSTETCNGVDDDCDGAVDEDPGSICGAGQYCQASSCVSCAAAPSASSVACGATSTGLSCSGSTYSVPGVLCDANHDGQPDPGVVCQENACVATGVFVDLPLLSAQEYGQPLRFDFTVTGWYDGLGVRGFGWADGATISHVNDNLFRYYQATTSNDLGAQTVEIEAYPVAGLNGDDDPVATATRSVTFTCQASNQCCANAHWQPEYATCTYNDDPNGGACQWSGNLLTCQPYCTETSEVRCDGDRLYAVDSCGALTAQIEDCGAAGLVCRDNACQR